MFTHFLLAAGFLTGASADLLSTALVGTTMPLVLGMSNGASQAAAVTGVANVRITSSMA